MMPVDPLSVRCPFVRCKMPPGEMCGEMGPFEWEPNKRPHPSRVRRARWEATYGFGSPGTHGDKS